MTLEFTPVGFALLAAVAAALALKPGWLFPLLIVSACLHAPAVLVVHPAHGGGAIGISPWLACAGACMAHLLWLLTRPGRRLVPPEPASRRLMLAWCGYFGVAILSALSLPWIFQGLGVFGLAERAGFDAPLIPLAWSVSNAIQSINAALILWLGVYARLCAAQPDFRQRVQTGLGIAIVLAVAFSLAQRLQWLGVLPPSAWIDASLNPSYVHAIGWGIHLQGLGTPRMAWPFSEPSYAAVWFASIYASGFAVLLLSRQPWLGGACVLVGGVATLNAFGMSGVASAITATLAIGSVYAWRKPWRDPLGMQRALILLLMVAAAIAAWQSREQVDSLRGLTLETVYQQMIVPRLQGEDVSGRTRGQSNAHAVRLLVDTWGLGTGLGSNRASSFFASALSCLGLVGTALLVYLLYRLLAGLLRRGAAGDNLALFVAIAMSSTLVGITLGIPDLNWPGWWIWPLIGVGLLAPAPHRELPAGILR